MALIYHSDYQDYLFNRSEVAALLESAGYPLQALSKDQGKREGEPPEWMRIYAAKSALRVHEAAWVINGKEPPESCPRSTVYDLNIRRTLQAIVDSVKLGDIETKNTDWHIDEEPQTWLVSHQSVIDWCGSVGYEWPLSQFMKPPQVEGETSIASPQHVNHQDKDRLHEEIATLRQEVAELRATVEELRKSVPLHPGSLMGMAIQAQHRYWGNPEESRPKSEVIIQELRKEYGITGAQASAVDKVACPINRNKGS
ncbi:hypothetical protein RSO41_14175 [Halomonas sp. I1]|uniref:hypothetical protein n=1 Tax=Halomonas sp. I1 TaxID=393536 RepID=UPI0028E09CDD|nr:hypothetical protein [Halomonas sp. I1]MDT8895801.1 hypothetical protein [Halomonas sp. I1]